MPDSSEYLIFCLFPFKEEPSSERWSKSNLCDNVKILFFKTKLTIKFWEIFRVISNKSKMVRKFKIFVWSRQGVKKFRILQKISIAALMTRLTN